MRTVSTANAQRSLEDVAILQVAVEKPRQPVFFATPGNQPVNMARYNVIVHPERRIGPDLLKLPLPIRRDKL